MRLLKDQDYLEKNIALRLDLNVPIKDGVVADATRIEACIPTIEQLLSADCKLLIISHLGRPTEGAFDKESSLEPVAKYLSNLLNLEIDQSLLKECMKVFFQEAL